MPRYLGFDLCQMNSKWIQRMARADNGRFLRHPSATEADDVGVTNIIPKVRGLNRNRGCAAVSIGDKCHEANDLHGQKPLQMRAAIA